MLQAMASAPKIPFPMLDRPLEECCEATVEIDQIEIVPTAYHRSSVDEKRIRQFAARIGKGEHFPPLLLWRDGERPILLDGLMRLAAFKALGCMKVSALVFQGDFATALAYAIARNKSRSGGMRRDSNAQFALTILATALERPVSREEATSVGILYSENMPLHPSHCKLMAVPSWSVEIKEKKWPRKPGVARTQAQGRQRGPAPR
jgi:hypothetical protein